MKKTGTLPMEDEHIVKQFSQLMGEKRQAYQKIEGLMGEISETRSRIMAIDKELEALIDIRTEFTRQEITQDYFTGPGIPSIGIAQYMIKYLDAQDAPISTDEIFDAVRAQLSNGNKRVSIKSIRSYLTNLKCFVNIKKKDIQAGKTHYSKPGWVLNRDILQATGEISA